MPQTHDRQFRAHWGDDEPPQYVINLYTWLTDRDAAADLAVKISEHVRTFEHVDRFATTVSVEGDATAEPNRVYADFAIPRNELPSQDPGNVPARLHLVP